MARGSKPTVIAEPAELTGAIDTPTSMILDCTPEVGAVEQAQYESAIALKASNHAAHATMERVLMHLCDLRSAIAAVDSQGALGAIKKLL